LESAICVPVFAALGSRERSLFNRGPVCRERYFRHRTQSQCSDSRDTARSTDAREAGFACACAAYSPKHASQQPSPPRAPQEPVEPVLAGSYIEGLKAVGLGDITVDELIALKVQGVTAGVCARNSGAGTPSGDQRDHRDEGSGRDPETFATCAPRA